MKLLTVRNIRFLWVSILICALSGNAWSQVYKIVDKDGNVTYTDTAPKDGSAPVKLPELSVIETPDYQVPARQVDEESEEQLSLRQLKARYKDFAITSPQQEESLFGADQDVNIQWATGTALRQGMSVNISVDGARLPATEQSSITIPPMDRGEHTVSATLVSEDGKVIANAAPVTFFVKTPNLNTNPQGVRPTPHN